jgi:probable rRNA maturation factor
MYQSKLQKLKTKIMVEIKIAKNFDGFDISLPEIKKLVKAVCKRFKLSNAAIDIAIVGDNEIQKLNRRFLNCSSKTDCLSFDLSGDSKSRKLFELVVNAEKAARQAKLRGLSPKAELALYITHGMLHNVGFDDSSPDKAKKMHDTEDEILTRFGFGSVYSKDIKAKNRRK